MVGQRRWVGWRRDAVVAVGCVVAMVLLGAPVGLLWAHVSPHVHTVITSQGVEITDAEPKAFIGSDAVFLFLTAGVGLVAAAVVGWFDRAPNPVTVIALCVGGGVAAVIAWHVGHRVNFDAFRHYLDHGRVGQHMDAIVRVRAKSVVIGWAFGAAVGYGGVVALRPAPVRTA